MNARKAWLAAIGCCLAAGILNYSFWRLVLCRCEHDSGGDVATGAQALSPPSSLKKSSHVAVDRSVPADDTSADVAARLSSEATGRQGVDTPDDASGSSPRSSALGDSPAGRLSPQILAEYEDSFLPTAAGLYSMSVEQWAQDEFLELTANEAARWFPLDATPGPMDLREMYGLPTEEECERALEDGEVKELLAGVCGYDLMLVELGSIPMARRTAVMCSTLERLVSERNAARAKLMKRLDRVSAYGEWALMDRLFVEWSK